MNFNDQPIEVRRTLLESSVGRVTIASHSLESNLKIILFSCFGFTDEAFDKEWDKPRTLGKIIKDLKQFSVFNSIEGDSLVSARDIRNEFTHNLSEKYAKSVKSGSSMFKLFQEFNELAQQIDNINSLVVDKLYEQASLGGVNVSKVNDLAKKNVDSWEDK